MAVKYVKNDLVPTPPTYLVGIDVASEKCTVVILKADKTVILKPLDFDNTRLGFEWLQQQLTRLEVTPSSILIGMEATARYWENLYIELESCGYAMILLHPAQTHQWAASRGLRAKTDRLDSLTIARHLFDDEARPAYVASDLIASYRELVRLHTRLSEEAARYKFEIRDLLVVLFPEFTQVFANPTAKAALALLKLYPSAQSFIEAGVETLSVKLHELAPVLATFIIRAHFLKSHSYICLELSKFTEKQEFLESLSPARVNIKPFL